MSLDSVDDLEMAEDALAGARDAIHSALSETIANTKVRRLLTDFVAQLDGYCRPTCGMDGEHHVDQSDFACGCPCHLRAAEDDTPPQVVIDAALYAFRQRPEDR